MISLQKEQLWITAYCKAYEDKRNVRLSSLAAEQESEQRSSLLHITHNSLWLL